MIDREALTEGNVTAYKAPCPHGRYEKHKVHSDDPDFDGGQIITKCPGGSLLPPDEVARWLIENSDAEEHDCLKYTTENLIVRGSDSASLQWIPPDSLVIVKENRQWAIYELAARLHITAGSAEDALDALAAAQPGET